MPQPVEFGEDQRFVLEHDQALHHVLEFADVARPFVREQRVLQHDRRPHRRPAIHRGELQQEELDQLRDLFTPLAQGRHVDFDHLQAIVEVFAEGAGAHHRVEVAIGRRDHPHVDVDGAIAAQLGELAILQHMENLGLQRLRHLADFVEQDGAVLRELELADAGGGGAGEGAALVPEQLAFEQFGRQGRAVDLHEGRAAARRSPVNLTRDHLLADAALTTQQHADIVVGDAIDHGHHRLHGLARTPARLGAIGILADLRAQPLHFAGQRQALEGIANGGFQCHLAHAVGVAGLDDVVDRAQADRLDDGGRGLAARQHDDLGGRMREPNRPQRLEAIEARH